jgi:signal transduction histidine kinase
VTRRLLGPLGGSIIFFLIAGLVLAGLGWVTVAALRVEDAQREAAARADFEKNLHLALWRLDGRLLQPLAVEDSRPFHHYATYKPADGGTAYGPACAPLVGAPLPDWMRLHFQIDPATGWESPQVLSPETAADLRRDWPNLSLRNVVAERAKLMDSLRAKYPPRDVIEVFTARERAIPPGAPPYSGPLFAETDGVSDLPSEGAEKSQAPTAPSPKPVPASEVPAGIPLPPVAVPPKTDPAATEALLRDENNKRAADFNAETLGRMRSDFAEVKGKAKDTPPPPAAQPPAPLPTPPDSNTVARSARNLEQQQGEYPRRLGTIDRSSSESQGQRTFTYSQNRQLASGPRGGGSGGGGGQPATNGAAPPSTVGKPTSGPPPVALHMGGGLGGYGFGSAGGFVGPGGPATAPAPTGSAPAATSSSGGPPPAALSKSAMAGGTASRGYERNTDERKRMATDAAKRAADGTTAAGMGVRAKGAAKDLADVAQAEGWFPNRPAAFAARLPAGRPATVDDRMSGESRGLFGLFDDVFRKESEQRRDVDGDRKMMRAAKKEGGAAQKDEPKPAAAVPAGGPLALNTPAPSVPPGLPGPAAGLAMPERRFAVPAAPAGPPVPAAPTTPPAKNPLPLTPDPAPQPKLEERAPEAARPAEPAALPDGPPAVSVHLGSMRPQWITAADKSEALVLVRAARLENKTVYQGVVLDWQKLQDLLKDEVKDLFPDARLVPVKDPAGVSRERAMTALPVQLDPGPVPEPPPAGWTPLRIGLVLAWTAALVAVLAVGLCGWSLIDLAERRIRFVSAVTHELRTPLTSLRLYIDLLLSGMVQDEEKRREYLSTLNVESDRLHRLIDNVLDYARLERRRKGGAMQPVKAADLLEHIRRTWADRLGTDGRELVVISTLPPEQEVVTDSSLVEQVVGNLIDNARKYTREATDPRIWLWAKPDGLGRVVLEVEDRGAGVEPHEQKLIFRPFRRGDAADTKAGGAGLGLALSKQWAEVLGGKLTYRTPDGGVGSCFRLELPVK